MSVPFKRPRGRPPLPGRPKSKILRVREGPFRLFKQAKEQLGFTKSSDSVFLEVLLHRCETSDRGNHDSQRASVSGCSFSKDFSNIKHSTPVKSVSAIVDVTGVSEMQSYIPPTPFNQNETVNGNPFSVLNDGNWQDLNESDDDNGEINEVETEGSSDNDSIIFERSMADILEELNESSEELSEESDDDYDVFLSFQEEKALDPVAMDISSNDSERTITMIDPYYGDSSEKSNCKSVFENGVQIDVSPEDVQRNIQEAPCDKTVENNKDNILQSVVKEFAELTKDESLNDYISLHARKRVIVSIQKLLDLAGSLCQARCGDNLCGETRKYTFNCIASRVVINWSCPNSHFGKWESSEVLVTKRNSNVYLNDCLLAAGISVTGNNYNKFKLFCKATGICTISDSSCLRMQSHCIAPVVKELWTKMQNIIVPTLKEYEEICLCGDGRNDSPGHNARYCVYTLMEHFTKLIVDTEIVDKRETGGNSVTMEREALRRLLVKMEQALPFDELVTDASSTIIKLVNDTKKKYPELLGLFHSLDVWHKSKKISKCLHKAAKIKECAILKDWTEDIVNHFWYCCQTAVGNPEKLKEAWFGLLHHVCGEHKWVGSECKHSPSTSEDRHTYLTKSSKAMEALRKIVLDPKWLKSLSFYVKFRHTSDLESFNNMLTKYAPKRMSFEYPYFIMRILLACIDHNMHLGRGLKLTAAGTERGHRKYSKRSKKFHAEPVKEEKEYSYHPYLMARILQERCQFKGSFTQSTDDNAFNPKQIAPTIGMKEPTPTEELMKGPSRLKKDHTE